MFCGMSKASKRSTPDLVGMQAFPQQRAVEGRYSVFQPPVVPLEPRIVELQVRSAVMLGKASYRGC